MPVLTLDFEYDGRPILEIYLTPCRDEVQITRQEGAPATPPCLVRALVDTGAGRSFIDPGILAQLALSPVSEGLVYTAAGMGPALRDLYVVDLFLAGDQPGRLARDLFVFGSPIVNDLRVGMLLGRDVLGGGILTYDGIHRRFTLAYNPPPRVF